MDYKLKCVFEHPTTNTAAAKTTAPNAAKSDTNTTNGKSKVTGDASKTSSKVKYFKYTYKFSIVY